MLYKMKTLDDGSRLYKARIAPHGNKDKEKEALRTDSASCPPAGIRLLLSVCNIMKWHVSNIDVSSAYLHFGTATSDAYVIPPKECKDRSSYWLLLYASYDLVNANAKWQKHSDSTHSNWGFKV